MGRRKVRITADTSWGDFADGIIAYEGRRGGGQVFLSFDRKAVLLVKATGGEAELLLEHR